MTKESMSLRLEPEIRKRVDAVATAMAVRTVGIEVTASAVIRAAIARGLEDLEHELGIKRGKR